MANDWRRLGKYVEERRRGLGLTQEDVRARGGPSTATMRLIEGALQDSYRPSILGRLERSLDWSAGSVQAILEGSEPTEAPRLRLPAQRVGGNRGDHPDEEPVPADDADIELVMDSDLPYEEKSRIVRELIEERGEERRRRYQRAQRLVDMYRRASGD